MGTESSLGSNCRALNKTPTSKTIRATAKHELPLPFIPCLLQTTPEDCMQSSGAPPDWDALTQIGQLLCSRSSHRTNQSPLKRGYVRRLRREKSDASSIVVVTSSHRMPDFQPCQGTSTTYRKLNLVRLFEYYSRIFIVTQFGHCRGYLAAHAALGLRAGRFFIPEKSMSSAEYQASINSRSFCSCLGWYVDTRSVEFTSVLDRIKTTGIHTQAEDESASQRAETGNA
ncbi:hypothetical protein T265_02882 [Opisthorchis viverrini]|uniref:Uncharacterized protein n=1 Tax=Opisthorchis viverrini TaxID=6198 RepID=A0A074ZUF0_OPIVI|nr:hypothetical protein T265_02882 [Opisthorchis viverrini]KER30731.1 hypothetical protein T265_02882 [Opisthorchis viverrini]